MLDKKQQSQAPWQVLDTGSIWLKEFACALKKIVPTDNWWPEIRTLGHWEKWERGEQLADPALMITRFPLQRGYARFPIAQCFPFEHALVDRIKRRCQRPEASTLICTAPFYAPVAERWPGPVVYYLTDLTKKYAGMKASQIVALDRRMCGVAQTVCPNSTRIADYLCEEAGCERDKITVVPNATREANVLFEPSKAPAHLPEDLADLPRPIIGVIGNLAGNMDWRLLTEAIDRSASVSWAFVGPTSMIIDEPAQEAARRKLLNRSGRIRFVGAKSYGQLCQYARSFDAALLPYRKKEPTYSGSATRFYEHLAAGRPILATRGFHELLSKEPLLKLVDNGDQLADEIVRLKELGFRDGFEEQRWRASQAGTWGVRARTLVQAASRNDRTKVA